jgi:hypothetical protein
MPFVCHEDNSRIFLKIFALCNIQILLEASKYAVYFQHTPLMHSCLSWLDYYHSMFCALLFWVLFSCGRNKVYSFFI